MFEASIKVSSSGGEIIAVAKVCKHLDEWPHHAVRSLLSALLGALAHLLLVKLLLHFSCAVLQLCCAGFDEFFNQDLRMRRVQVWHTRLRVPVALSSSLLPPYLSLARSHKRTLLMST